MQDQEYESKCHKQLFQDEWKRDRPWLRVETTNHTQVMFCDFCIAAGIQSDRNVFLKGCTNLKLNTIKYHKGSNSPLLSTNKYRKTQKLSEAPAYKAKLSLNKAMYAKLSILFRTTHALNVKARPANDYIWMNELHKSNGLDGGDRYSTKV